MNSNGEPSCTCEEKGRTGAKGTEWAEFRFSLDCPFHFPHSSTDTKKDSR